MSAPSILEEQHLAAVPGHPAAMETLLSRQSVSRLREPAPSETELALILEAGLRAPDHGRLRPWRFVVIRGAARSAFAELLVEAIRQREPNPPAALIERQHAKIEGVPLVIAVGAKITLDGPIPKIEQLLSAAAAAMNMLNAIHALGYGGVWVTGANTYDGRVNQALGFSWPNRLVGFLFTGTPQDTPRPARRPRLADHVSEWTGGS
jgi:nitroreductase